MSETRKVRDLLTAVYGNVNTYVWRGAQYTRDGWVNLPAPVGGDSVTLDTFGMVSTTRIDTRADDVVYLAIPTTGWSEFSGGTIDRSNCRSILRDYGQHVIHVTGAHDFEELMLPMDGEIPADLFDVIVALSDYPLYDEDDHSELEREIEIENWGSWGRSDFIAEVREIAGEDVEELDDDEYADRLFEYLSSEGTVHWVSESADSGFWEGMDDAVEAAWEIIRSVRA